MPPSNTNDPFLEVKNVHKSFQLGSQTVNVLNGINLTLQRGDMLTMIGASGAGKSTFLHILGTLDQPTRGNVLYEGQDVFRLSENDLANFRNRRIGFVFQFFNLIPTLTVGENLALPLELLGSDREDNQRRVEESLAMVELSSRRHSFPDRLSGGEQQRIAIARALIHEPRIVLADEPTGNLDRDSADIVASMLFDLHRKQNTILVIVTHNTDLAARCSVRFLSLIHI